MEIKQTKSKSVKPLEVIEEHGTLGERTDGSVVKLRLVKWYGKEEVYDIRPWKTEENGEEKALKGVTLTSEELEKLKEILGK